MAPTPPVNNTNTAQRPTVRIPPEENLWKRYSRHHEFPVSLSTSTAVHLLFIILLALIAFGVITWVTSKDDPPALGGVVEVGEVGGGGGHPDGQGKGPGDGNPDAGGKEDTGEDSKEPPKDQRLPAEQVQFHDVKIAAPTFDFLVVPPGTKPVTDNPTEAMQSLEKVQTGARKKLLEGLAAGKGQGGSGKEGGKDSGVGTGEGSKIGPGKGNLTVNERMKRALRWTMIFNTANGNDYKTQLAHLGAIIAVPEGGDEYLVFRDLNQARPQGQREDVRQINRIFWIDDKPQSVNSLAGALGIAPPPHFVAFFPESLEKQLLELELDHAKGKTEDEIQETKFQIVRRQGKYAPVVVNQR